MHSDQILAQTFADHESLSPDPEATLDGVRRQLHARRRRAVTRSLTVAAAAATVAAVAIGASALGGGQPAAPTRSGQPAGPGRPAGTPANPPAAASAGELGFLTFGPGWLPAGARQILASHSSRDGSGDGQRLGYETRAAVPGRVAQIGLTLGVGEQPDNTPDSSYGAPRATSVSGRPGTEWSGAAGYYVAFTLPSGQPVTVDVNIPRGTASATTALRTVGRHVATALRFDQHTALPTSFTLGYLPAGYVIRGVSVQRGTSYVLGRPGSGNGDTPYITVGEVQGGREQIFPQGGGKIRPTPTAGRPVNGRPTWLVTSRDYPGLYVEHYRPGWSLAAFGTAITTDFTELYRIAQSVRAG